MINRSQAECGLREKGRGKSLPEMTRQEALILLIVSMTVHKATGAGEEGGEWLEVREAIFEREPASEVIEDEVDRRFGHRKYVCDSVHPLLETYRRNKNRNVWLVNCDAFCHLIQNGTLITYSFRLVFDISHGCAAIEVSDPVCSLVDTYSFYLSGFSTEPMKKRASTAQPTSTAKRLWRLFRERLILWRRADA